MIKKIINIALAGVLIIIGLTGDIFTVYSEEAQAIMTGESGQYISDSNGTWCNDSNHEIGATKVNYGGYTWDIIGFNNAEAKKGVSGPNDTVTLLLDRSSYRSFTASPINFSASNSTNIYKDSILFKAMNKYANSLTTTNDIVSKTLTGGSKTGASVTGYNADDIAGDTVTNQKLWPLSVNEAGQLKTSVRVFPARWWLRTPGDNSYKAAIVSGHFNYDDYDDYDYYSNDSNDDQYCFYGRDEAAIVSYGVDVYGTNYYNLFAVRPALYLSFSSPIFSSIKKELINGAKKIGAYETVPQITDSNGYTWDIVGLNESGISKGVTTPTSNATLLLSQTSSKKIESSDSNFTGKIYNIYSIYNTDAGGSIYKDSTISKIMSSFYTELQSDSTYQITERTLTGGSNTYGPGNLSNYNEDRIAGDTVSNQGVWTLSVKESKQLDYKTRLFPENWWLRTPGENGNMASVVKFTGSVNIIGYGVRNYRYDDYDYFAVRPALYINLSSSIFQNNINSGQLSASWKTEMPDSNVEIPFTPAVSVAKITMTPNTATLTIGSTKILKATVTPSNATNKTVTWSTSNTKIAKVSTTGKVTAVAPGAATITVISLITARLLKRQLRLILKHSG
jgi:uncharacterized protein YjdB